MMPRNTFIDSHGPGPYNAAAGYGPQTILNVADCVEPTLELMPRNTFIDSHSSGPYNVAASYGPQTIPNGAGTQNNYGGCTVHSKPSRGYVTEESQGSIPARPSRREDFHIALICALPLEYDAVALQFDEFWDEDGEQYGRAPGDMNTYTTGRIGKHNIVLALLPNMGKAAAAGSAASLRASYPGLRLACLVGVCGGIPGVGAYDEAPLLGDVVISKTVIQFEFVTKDTVDDILGRANKDIRALTASFETELGRERLRKKTGEYLKDLQGAAARKRRRQRYRYLGVAEDKLFAATYRHRHRAPQSCAICEEESDGYCAAAAQASCVELNCDEGQLVTRELLEVKQSLEPDEIQCPEIFVGRIASGDTVMKSGEHRDRLAKQRNVIAFEMEGAGAWDEVPCIIIKGICDYADSHKNKAWQPFAAATAASVMKAVLGRYAPTDRITPA